VYLALYGLEGLVIFDHPYNAEYERLPAGVSDAFCGIPIIQFWRYLCACIASCEGLQLSTTSVGAMPCRGGVVWDCPGAIPSRGDRLRRGVTIAAWQRGTLLGW
jgi:hypothetical protein